MGSHVISATEFKAKCLSVMDEIGKTGATVIVTKRGKPVATVGPVSPRMPRSSKGLLKGKVHIPDELLMADTSDLWDVLRNDVLSNRETFGL